MDHERSIQESIQAVVAVHDRALRNQLVRRTMEQAGLPAEVRLGMHELMAYLQKPVATSQDFHSMYAALGHVINYCHVLREEIQAEVRGTSESATRKRNMWRRVLLEYTRETFPAIYAELCDRITDLLLVVWRTDVSTNGESSTVLGTHPDLCRGLRELIEMTAPVR